MLGIASLPFDAANYKKSSSCGTFTDTSGGAVDVTNLTVTITCSGRPILVGLVSDDSASFSGMEVSNNIGHAATSAQAFLYLFRGVTQIGGARLNKYSDGAATVINDIAANVSLFALDAPGAGTFTYKVQAKSNDANTTVSLYVVKLIAIEL